MASPLRKKTLFLSLDAFGTIFHPRRPIAQQYGEVGKQYGFKDIQSDDLQQSFRKAFKQESRKNPNYGKVTGMNASQWWANIIKNTFTPYISRHGAPNNVPDKMIEALLHHFSSKDGYEIFPDAQRLFLALRIARKSIPENADWPWGRTIVNITSNSDDRIKGVLESLQVIIGNGADIENVTLSYDVGSEKPDSRMFEYAARNAPEDAVKVHVGDDLEHDAVGAFGAGDGWHGILLDREKNYEEWNGDQEHHGLVKIEHNGHIIPVLDSLDSLRHWNPDP